MLPACLHIRHPSATLSDILSPSLSLGDSLSVPRKWLAVDEHISKLGNIQGPFGHFFGHPLGETCCVC